MLSVRKVKTKSGSIAVQVVRYIGHKSEIKKHIGSGKNEEEVFELVQIAQEWILDQTKQLSLFPLNSQKVLIIERGECIGVTHQFAKDFFSKCIDKCGLNYLPALLLDFAIMRLIEPASKLRTIELLNQYFGVQYSQRIYRNIPKLLSYKDQIENSSFQLAKCEFNESFYFVLYDVTTLYFETFKADDLRVPGFSKDNKSQQPQIVIGLLVTQNGFPLLYEVFAGNTFEGKTMLPIVYKFIDAHKNVNPIVVADAAMLDEERLTELQQKELSYIVGARLANSSLSLINKIHTGLNGNVKKTIRVNSKHGYLVCDFSDKRFKKELNELNRLVKKAEDLVARQSTGKKTAFVKKISKDSVELNVELIEKRKLLLGIKGYVTNIPEEKLSNEKVISNYHQLWNVEQSFRMSKHDIQSRPIYHYNEKAVRAHILICFVALILQKYLELKSKLSLRDIRDIIWNITETHIQDKFTKEIFTFRSPMANFNNSTLRKLIKEWGDLPH